jgi:hypothetical protein
MNQGFARKAGMISAPTADPQGADTRLLRAPAAFKAAKRTDSRLDAGAAWPSKY